MESKREHIKQHFVHLWITLTRDSFENNEKTNLSLWGRGGRSVFAEWLKKCS